MKNYLDLFDNIIDILAYYDRPVLFVSEINKIKYICELINDNGKIEEWLISDITDDTYDSLKALNIDLHNCFKHSMSGTSKILQVNNKGIESISDIYSTNIPDEDLPLKGIYMREKKEDNSFSCNSPHL